MQINREQIDWNRLNVNRNRMQRRCPDQNSSLALPLLPPFRGRGWAKRLRHRSFLHLLHRHLLCLCKVFPVPVDPLLWKLDLFHFSNLFMKLFSHLSSDFFIFLSVFTIFLLLRWVHQASSVHSFQQLTCWNNLKDFITCSCTSFLVFLKLVSSSELTCKHTLSIAAWLHLSLYKNAPRSGKNSFLKNAVPNTYDVMAWLWNLCVFDTPNYSILLRF